MNNKTIASDVVIVGGGLMGAASAFFLRQRGLSVALLERGLVGQQASGVNFGNVRRQGRFLPQLPLAHRSRDIWGRLKDLIGHDSEFLAAGHIRLAYDTATFANLEQYAKDAKPWGLNLEVLGQSQIRARFPYLSREVVGGTLSPEDGHANPRLTTPLFGRAARKAGASVVENCEVLDVQKTASDFKVTAADGLIVTAPIALICAGAWAGRISASFGETVPMAPQGPVMGVTEPVPYGLVPLLGVSGAGSDGKKGTGIYLRQITRGNIVFGGGPRCAAYLDERRARPPAASTLDQLAQLRRVIPAMANVSVIRTWSGVEGFLDDQIPVMGPSRKVSGLYYAFGFCGHGFQLGPAVGDVMAELIARGETTTPIDRFSIGRFERLELADSTGREVTKVPATGEGQSCGLRPIT